jgi:hypothetical protein
MAPNFGQAFSFRAVYNETSIAESSRVMSIMLMLLNMWTMLINLVVLIM